MALVPTPAKHALQGPSPPQQGLQLAFFVPSGLIRFWVIRSALSALPTRSLSMPLHLAFPHAPLAPQTCFRLKDHLVARLYCAAPELCASSREAALPSARHVLQVLTVLTPTACLALHAQLARLHRKPALAGARLVFPALSLPSALWLAVLVRRALCPL